MLKVSNGFLNTCGWCMSSRASHPVGCAVVRAQMGKSWTRKTHSHHHLNQLMSDHRTYWERGSALVLSSTVIPESFLNQLSFLFFRCLSHESVSQCLRIMDLLGGVLFIVTFWLSPWLEQFMRPCVYTKSKAKSCFEVFTQWWDPPLW